MRSWADAAGRICQRRSGVGGDGLLLLEDSKKADVKMRVFNPNGSEAAMCGNGSRCAALYCRKKRVRIETKAGILHAELPSMNRVKVRITEPKNIRTDFGIKLNGQIYEIHLIDTGVPHAVHFVHNIDNVDVKGLGEKIRYHRSFQPDGTNADFVKVLNARSVALRTYERGVEDETLACGTGACAVAVIASFKKGAASPVDVHTRSGETLKVYFERNETTVKDVFLEGDVRTVYSGVIVL